MFPSAFLLFFPNILSNRRLKRRWRITSWIFQNKKYSEDTDEERMIFLQKVLLDFLSVKAQSDQSYKYARHFYISQWYKDVVNEKMHLASGNKSGRKNNVHKSKRKDDSDDEMTEEDHKESLIRENAEKFKLLDERKKFLISKIKPFQEAISSGNRVQIFQTYIDYNSAELIAQYLASKRFFCQSFDKYLKAVSRKASKFLKQAIFRSFY